MKILITTPSLDRSFGGPAAKAHELGLALRALGHRVRLVGCGPSSDLAVGLPVRARYRATPIPARIAPIRKLVQGAEVVHILGFRDPIGTLGAAAAWRSTKPYIIEPVGMLQRRFRSLALKTAYDLSIGRLVLSGAQGLVATSNREVTEIRTAIPYLDKVVWVRPNGISVDDSASPPSPGEFRRRYGIPASSPVVLVLARISALKGIRSFAEAIIRLAGTVGVIAGPDERDGTLDWLRTLIEKRPLADRLRVLPAGIWGRQKAEALADVDCLCLPSESDSFGTAALEGAIAGLPVVISSESGAREWLPSDSTIVFQFGDVTQLAQALGMALDDQRFRNAARSNARQLQERFRWSRVAEAQVEIYERACQA